MSFMTYEALNYILTSYEESSVDELFEWEYQISTFLYQNYKDTAPCDIPVGLMVFTELDNWQGMSQRCGVWQYYESRSFMSGVFEKVVSYLKALGETELADIYCLGIHNYSAPEYIKSGEYPEEWLAEAEKIDEWIYEKKNSDLVYGLKRSIILENRVKLLKLVDNI